ncbi:glycosyltransferase [Glaciimonas sp. CA11.2]|uniref:glycosyltransferase family 8 protein n=1 Tax=unclassified Glaciimonas TaxID=2644401 RepID=UPI002AB35769|nr:MULTISPECIES: glycosyltransferase [unclassified Glaciimonas]MDY7546924.1 glycosyltransferase [Glaciimonas sp. CA11.2]MEB0012387.1 glycosyltransferase [Glaciimonas sp. Cout2]MEB0080421.1 glycosyltransferase [Glaciimonas sp. Gout2]MEB0163005.1 glycosyltransferase [Glaciimonas sp. CA11.2]
MHASLNAISQSSEKNPSRSFHIAFCVDDHYCRSMGATITSIIDNNPGVDFTFHVFAFAISEDNRQRFNQLTTKYGVATHIHIIDPVIFKPFAHISQFSYYSPTIFTRLLIPSTLQGITDKVLYLDADILCLGSIAELIQMDFGDSAAIVVPDADETTRRRCAALQLSSQRYFNSGVMYMNVDVWMSQQITEKTILSILENGKNYRFPDQDALNVVLEGKITFIERKWNFLYDLIHDLEKDKRQMRDIGEIGFIHFAGAVKPWNDWCLHASTDLFIKYHKLSPWADIALDPEPRNYKEMRMFSRFLMKRGEVFNSFKWYMKYLSAR